MISLMVDILHGDFYPEKTFLDSRTLNLTVMAEYAWIENAVKSYTGKELAPGKMPLWERLLEHYNINFIFLGPLDVYGKVPEIIFKLAEGDKWVPVYCDPISIIFIKNTERNREIIARSKLSKEVVYNTVIYAAVQGAIRNQVSYFYSRPLAKPFTRWGS